MRRRTSVTAAPAALLVALSAAGAAAAADWPQWRGPERTGAAAESPPLRADLPPDGLAPVWFAPMPQGVGNGGWGSPVVADGKTLLALHLRNRKEGVRLPPEEFPPLSEERQAAMPEAERKAYEEKRRAEQQKRRAVSLDCTDALFCYDAKTGKELWRSETPVRSTRFAQSTTPAVAGDRVYHLTADRELRCVDLADGRELWVTPLLAAGAVEDAAAPDAAGSSAEHAEAGDAGSGDEQIPSSVLVAGGKAVVFVGPLVAVDAESGTVLWRNETLRTRDASPAAWRDGDRLRFVVNTRDGKTYLVDPEAGEPIWSIDSGARRSTPVVAGSILVTYADSRKGGVRAWRMSEAGAEPIWSYQRLSDPGATPAVADGRVYVPGDNRFACLDLETGDPVWETRLALAGPRYTSPVAGGGLAVYTFGELTAFREESDGEPAFTAVVAEGGRAASEERLRETLGLPADPKERAAAWEKAVGRHGPLDCTSPALSDGRLYVRLKGGLACYDLRAGSTRTAAAP